MPSVLVASDAVMHWVNADSTIRSELDQKSV